MTRDGQRRVLAAIDDAARRLGLVPAMAVAQAQALVPELMLVPAVPEEDAAGLGRLCDWCHRFGPVVAPDAPDGLYLDATGLAHLYGGESALLAVLESRLRDLGLALRLGLADTPGAAHAWARFGSGGIIEAGGQSQALARLPVAALRINAASAKRLAQLGLARIGQLYDMPRAPLARRFGAALITRLDQALGRAEEPIAPTRPESVPSQRLGFAEPIATPEDIARAIQHLTRALCTILAERDQGARRLVLLCHRVDGRQARIAIGTVGANRDAVHLARLLTDRIDTIDPGYGIEAMVLTATRTDPLVPEQWGVGEEGASSTGLDTLIDRLASRLGETRIFRLMPIESDWPEHAVRRVAPLAPAPTTPTGPPRHWPRPVRLLRYPEPIETVALLPDHAPAFFTWSGIRHRVTAADGPERLYGEWWRGGGEGGRERDYFQVEDETGRRFWLFREGAGWFLHGFFA